MRPSAALEPAALVFLRPARALHHPGLITAALTSVNLSQLPSSLVVAVASRQVVGRRWPIAAAGLLILAAVCALQLAGGWIIPGAAILGFSAGLVFVLSLALPPLLAGPGEVHHLSAAMFTITYSCSFAGSLLGGALWDATSIPIAAFVPVLAAGMGMVYLVFGLNIWGRAEIRHEQVS